jgi:orotate phosphoribosyltransferase
MKQNLIDLLNMQRGHFEYESGHHGDLWLDLEDLFIRPAALRDPIRELARRLKPYDTDLICGPMTSGALVAFGVATELDQEFCYSDRLLLPSPSGTPAVRYAIPDSVRGRLSGKRVAIVDDVINAGSAAGGTIADLQACGAVCVAVGALIVLDSGKGQPRVLAGLPVERVETFASKLWDARNCPLCRAGTPLDKSALNLT